MGTGPQITKVVLKEAEAARHLGVSTATLRRARSEGTRDNRFPPPAFLQLGRTIRYLQSDLDEYLKSHRVIQTPPDTPE